MNSDIRGMIGRGLIALTGTLLASTSSADVQGPVRVYPYTRNSELVRSTMEIVASSENVISNLNEQDWFHLTGVQPSRDLDVTWRFSRVPEASEPAYVLWPYRHPRRAQNPYDQFRVKLLTDVTTLTLTTVASDIDQGRFADASSKVTDSLALLDVARQQPPMTAEALRQRYAILKAVTAMAAEYRSSIGRSAVSNDAIRVERGWLRHRINSWNSASLQMSSLAQDLSDWALFSRQIYSYRQQAWPDRSMDESNDPDRPLLQSTDAQSWLEEDISLVQQVLLANDIKAFLSSPAIRTPLAKLTPADKDTLVHMEWLEADPRSIKMSQLARSLAALYTVTR